jgi:hypothetical protein
VGPRSSVHAALCVGALLAVLLSASGCSNTCDYGTSGSNGNCKSRPEPSAKEKEGFRASSLTPRFEALRRHKDARDGVDTVNVNRWGEIGAGRNGDWIWTSNVDGKPVGKTGTLSASGEGTESFDPADADPRAIDRAMNEIFRRDPDAAFVAGALALAHPRVEGGADITRNELRWRVTTNTGKVFAYYETDRRGRLRCVILSTDATGRCRKL